VGLDVQVLAAEVLAENWTQAQAVAALVVPATQAQASGMTSAAAAPELGASALPTRSFDDELRAPQAYGHTNSQSEQPGQRKQRR